MQSSIKYYIPERQNCFLYVEFNSGDAAQKATVKLGELGEVPVLEKSEYVSKSKERSAWKDRCISKADRILDGQGCNSTIGRLLDFHGSGGKEIHKRKIARQGMGILHIGQSSGEAFIKKPKRDTDKDWPQKMFLLHPNVSPRCPKRAVRAIDFGQVCA